jgi:hypothetical protein
MVNYEFGKIYRLYNDDNDEVYIGSTSQKDPRRRYDRHKEQDRLGQTMYGSIFATPNHHLEVIEDYPCETRKELFLRERYWYDTLKEAGVNLINKNIPICYTDIERVKRAKEQRDKYFKSEKGIATKKRNQEMTAKRRVLQNQILKLNQELASLYCE